MELSVAILLLLLDLRRLLHQVDGLLFKADEIIRGLSLRLLFICYQSAKNIEGRLVGVVSGGFDLFLDGLLRVLLGLHDLTLGLGW